MYRKSVRFAVVLIVAGVTCFWLCDPGVAQLRRMVPRTRTGARTSGPRSDRSKNLRIKKLKGLLDAGRIKPPRYTFNDFPEVHRKSNPEWGRIQVEYDTEPEWIDALVIRFHVLLVSRAGSKTKPKEDEEGPLSLLEGSVTYIDVPEDRGHLAAMYIHPNVLERYGDIAAVGVEIIYDEETVHKAEISKRSGLTLAGEKKEEWWVHIRDHRLVVRRDGYLLKRTRTPFVLANYHAFEMIRD